MALIKTKTNYQWDKKQPTPEGVETDTDALVRQLQLMVKDVRDDIFQLNPTLFTTLPTAEEDKRGSLVIKEETAVADKLNVCMRTAAGGFEFRQISPVEAIILASIEDDDSDTKVETERTADDDIIYLRNAGTDSVIINASGEMTKPTQPAFLVTNSGAQDDISNSGSPITIVLDSEIYDIGSNFAANTFTAPVTGKYQLSLKLNLTNMDSASTTYHIIISTSNRSYSLFLDPRQFAGDVAGRWPFALSILADMDASDTAICTFTQDVGTAQTDLEAGIVHFSGFLAV